MTEETNKPPLATYREGKAKVTLWENENVDKKTGEKFKSKTYQCVKNYKQGDEWKQTNSYTRRDLKDLKVAIDKALLAEEETENEEGA